MKIKYTKRLENHFSVSGVNGIPDEILLDIIGYIGVLGAVSLKTVCKRWYRIIKGDMKPPKWINRFIIPSIYPLPYQFDVVKWMVSQKKGGIINMEQGMGKTNTCLTYINATYSLRNLVVCNKSQIKIWRDETKKFYGNKLKVICCHVECDGDVRDFSKKTLELYDIVVITYQAVRYLSISAYDISHMYWNNVFCDEVHVLRNKPASMYPFIDSIKKTKLWGLTGSLIFNSINDMKNIQHLIDPPSAYSNHNVKKLLFSDVNTKLPSLAVHQESTPRTKEQDRIYKLYESKAIDLLANMGANFKTMASIFTIIHRLRQISISLALLKKSHTKMADLQITDTYKSPRIEAICKSIQKDTQQSIVFSYYTDTLELVSMNLGERGIKCCVIYSTDTVDQRDYKINRFINKKYRTLLMTYGVGSHGYNLVNASKVYLAEIWWNMQIMQQAFKRAYRLGQDKPVHVYMYVTDDSIEKRMLEICVEKKKIEDALLSECKSKTKLTLSEIKKLF